MANLPSDTEGQPGESQQTWALAALSGSCPKCGARTLFDGVINFAPKCRACGLDFLHFNVGDGPAAFLTLIIGAVIVILALVVDSAFQPPIWVHALLWIPLTALLVVGGLRGCKAWLLISEYRRNAGEGQVKK
ncbi:DUF983 domain-containing protein [Novosphingobium sp.]|uniref:DUF983 domain-containing protein n=1 Tax=Novosphingobium sp. TaxID=1874826 RepID=UPI0025F824A9|nr:DUF983 domain-containing protein [Novosphingobium sp.]